MGYDGSYKIGDIVRCISDCPDGNTNIRAGMTGTVANIDIHLYERNTGYKSIGVDWDENIDGHDINGACERGHGWWMRPSEIEHADPESCAELETTDVTDSDFLALFCGDFQ